MLADSFAPKDDYYESQIEQILGHIVSCHNLMLFDNEPIAKNENKIRNRLVKRYLKNNKVKNKIGIQGFRFSAEEAIIDTNDDEVGYTDIQVIMEHEFDNDDVFFVLECKLLDGKGDLSKSNFNGKYITNGVMRFTTPIPPKTIPKYPTNLRVNGMIGFCIEKFNIHENSTIKLNQHLDKWCPNETILPLTQEAFIENFGYTYISSHCIIPSKDDFKLYHLMLDTSSLH